MSDFSYHSDKDGKIRITNRGRDVVALKDATALRISSSTRTSTRRDCNSRIARMTGHFKRGDESHPANTLKKSLTHAQYRSRSFRRPRLLPLPRRT